MAIEWPRTPLGELVQNFDSRRIPLSSRDREKRRGQYPYYGATGVMDHVNDFLFEGLHLLVAEDGSVERPDGKPFLQLVDGRFWVNNHAHVLKGATDDDTRYLYYALSTVAIRPYMSGSVQAKLSQGNLNRIPTPYPADQIDRRTIAHILGTLDDKIELNRRMNETLEATARALFKSWFVDFGTVRAKADGRDPGLPRTLADLFPDRLVDSEVGEIPEGWEMASVGDHFDAVKGLSYKGSGLADSGVPLHNLNSVYEGGGYKYEGIKYYTGEYGDRHVVRPGDVIVANTEQGHDRLLIGYAALVPRAFGDIGIASHHIYRLRLRSHSTLKSAFLCYLLNSPQMHDIVSGYANGTTVNMLPIDGVQRPMIVIPPRALLELFASFAENCERRREGIVAESRTLATLRDTLLPKLVSGELRVKDAERIAARVT